MVPRNPATTGDDIAQSAASGRIRAAAATPSTGPSPLGVAALRRFGARPALVDGETTVTYFDLADRIEDRVAELGAGRRVVALDGSTHVEFVVGYLACLEAGHPALVVPPGSVDGPLATAHRPDTIIRSTGDRVHVHHPTPAAETPGADLHPDLAALMSTSGSTGASKVVRLSHEAISSNALAIAESIGLGADDRAITTLPLHYCYGLSVVTSHLAVGASVVLTDLSVVDPCFWDLVDRAGVTTLAGVPYTFEMIERVGLDVLDRPSLRLLTQAGGRLAPDLVTRLADAGRHTGWGLAVMYGQTEATARMACLAPHLVAGAPDSVGRAIPGGTLSIADPDDHGIGEIVYRGPNVMMGYATDRSDLARGHDLDELPTGDLGRIDERGLLRVVGRTSRISKIHGVRVDLDAVETALADEFGPVRCVGDDDGLGIALTDSDSPTDDRRAADVAARLAGIPARLVAVAGIDEPPRTASGKVDQTALLAEIRGHAAIRDGGVELEATAASDASSSDAVRALYAEILGVSVVAGTDSFASLGGDSLSFVETSIRLESIVGALPEVWHLTPIDRLVAHGDRPPSDRVHRLDIAVVLRAVLIVTIVCTHMGVARIAGGAHALIAVIGFNAARFQFAAADVPGRVRRGLRSVARVAVPTTAWIGINMAIAGGYGLASLFLVNNYLGSPWRTDGRWQYWYFEAFAQIMIVLVALSAIPAFRRAHRRAPYLVALGAVAITLPLRFEWVALGDPYNEIFRTHTVLCFAAVGWLAAVSRTTVQRIATTGVAAVVTLGYFETVGRVDQLDREIRILAALLALTWIRSIPLPRAFAVVVGWVAAASMWIFLVHWQVWPPLARTFDDRFALVLTIAVGVVVWAAVERIALRRGAAAAFAARRRTRRTGRFRPDRRDGQVDERSGTSTSSHVKVADTAMSTSDITPVSA